MQISQAGLDFIKKKEGYFENAYLCPAGVWTIGFGTIRWDLKTPVKEGDTITREEAEIQLRKEVQRAEDAVTEAIKVPLSQGQFDALVSFAYNVGTSWITGRGHQQATLVKLLNQGKYDAVPAQLLRFSRTTGGKKLDGLLKRRKEEAQMWLSDAHEAVVANAVETEPGTMPQGVAPEKASTAVDVAKRSWTVRGAALGGIAWLVQAADKVIGFSKETAEQVVSTTNDLGALKSLGVTLLHNSDKVTMIVTAIALAIVLIRRFDAGFSGKEG